MLLLTGGNGAGGRDATAIDDEVDRRVRERTAHLEAVNRELEDFVAAVSHDLRAPLRAIHGFTWIVIEEQGALLDAAAIRRLEHVRLSASRMAGMLEGLLRFARTGQKDLAKSEVDLGRMAGEIVQRLRREDPGREVACEIRGPLFARGDEALLAIVLENLIGNAWKYTRHTPGARIVFAASEQAGRQVFIVSDNGIGFDPAESRRLFRPFQRLHHEEEFPGVGIGLATVRRIITRHGGGIWADGTPGAGASFTFTL